MIRKNPLWNVPVYCLAASWLCYWITVLLGRYIYVVRTVGADGVVNATIDPVRSMLFNTVLFLSVLLIGGLWALRGMTKKELALSAGIISMVYLFITVLEVCLPGFPVSLNLFFAKFMDWPGILYAMGFELFGPAPLLLYASCFAPMLFVLFGKSSPPDPE